MILSSLLLTGVLSAGGCSDKGAKQSGTDFTATHTATI